MTLTLLNQSCPEAHIPLNIFIYMANKFSLAFYSVCVSVTKRKTKKPKLIQHTPLQFITVVLHGISL
jgi:hypothetical protein